MKNTISCLVMREYILIEKRYLKLPTIRLLCLIHFAYLVVIFCDRKLLNSTAGHLFLHNFPTQHLFCDRKLLKSTAGNLFLHTLPTWHLFCDRKLLSPLPGIYFYTTYLPGTSFAVERFCACSLQLPGIDVLGLSLPAAGHADTAFVNCNQAAWQLMEVEVSELYCIK